MADACDRTCHREGDLQACSNLTTAGLTGVLAAAAALRHACTPLVPNLGHVNPYVAAAFEEWGLGGGKDNLTAVVARQAAASPAHTDAPVAGKPVHVSNMVSTDATGHRQSW